MGNSPRGYPGRQLTRRTWTTEHCTEIWWTIWAWVRVRQGHDTELDQNRLRSKGDSEAVFGSSESFQVLSIIFASQNPFHAEFSKPHYSNRTRLLQMPSKWFMTVTIITLKGSKRTKSHIGFATWRATLFKLNCRNGDWVPHHRQWQAKLGPGDFRFPMFPCFDSSHGPCSAVKWR